MKNLPSNRASRDSLAREHTRQSRFISFAIHDSRFSRNNWTFSDCAPPGLSVFLADGAEPMARTRSRSANVQPDPIGRSILGMDDPYDCPCSPLRGMFEVPYPIPDRIQSVPKRLVSAACGARLIYRMDALLLLRIACELEPLELRRFAALQGFRVGPRSRLRTAG